MNMHEAQVPRRAEKIGRKRGSDRSAPATLISDLDAAQSDGLCSRSSSATASSGAWNGAVPSPTKQSGCWPQNLGDVVVDDPRGGDAEIGGDTVEGLRRRGGDRLDVDPHPDPCRRAASRSKVNCRRVRRACSRLTSRVRLVGELVTRLPVHAEGPAAATNLLGFRGQQVAVDVDGEYLPRACAGAQAAPGVVQSSGRQI